MEYKWTIVIRANFPKFGHTDWAGGIFEGTYEIVASRRYFAIRDALNQFILDNHLPFRVYQILDKYRDFTEISAKCSEDGRVKA